MPKTYHLPRSNQYKYTSGKNSTDSAMIIDAMDILHRENVDGFCLISSDSDFTRLTTRIRESGKLVIGMGEEKTPKPFVTACNRFIYIELLQKEALKAFLSIISKKALANFFVSA